MMGILDIALILLYLCGITYFGLFSVKPAKTIEQYAVGDRNFSTYNLVGTIFATWIGSVALFNTLSQGFIVGISYVFIILGDVVNLILYARLGKYFHARFKSAISIGDIIEPGFGVLARIISGIISSLVCLCYITAQLKGINLLFEYFFAIPHFVSIGLSTLIIMAYSTLGGVNAVVKTDKLQFIIILLFILLLLNNVAPKSFSDLSIEKLELCLDYHFYHKYFGLFISFLIPLMLPHVIQRILISKNDTQCKNAFYISAILSFVFYLICIILGIFAFSLNPKLDESHVLLFLLEKNLGPGMLGVGFIGVMSILISTVDSFMNIAAVNLSHDVLKPLFGGRFNSALEVRLAKLCNIFMSILAYGLSVEFDGILEIILYALNLWGPLMTIPIYVSILGIKVPKETFYISLITSVVVIVFWEYKYEGVNQLFAFMPGTLSSLVIFINAWLLSWYFKKNPV